MIICGMLFPSAGQAEKAALRTSRHNYYIIQYPVYKKQVCAIHFHKPSYSADEEHMMILRQTPQKGVII